MVLIRTATLQDCRLCEELSRIKELTPADGTYITEEYFRCFVDPYDLFFVAEDHGEIVGYILGEPMKGNMAHLGLLTVSEAMRGKGIGKRLVTAFREKCEALGLDILLYAPLDNPSTLAFYRGQGFTEGKVHVNFLDVRKPVS